MPPRLLVTGSSGLIGSEVVSFFAAQNWTVFGIDNNERARFFGPDGDTRWNQARLAAAHKTFAHIELDIRDREGMLACMERVRPDLVVHAAAQPSHDLAATHPFEDFDVNAGGTLNILEAIRRHAPSAVYVHLSTNKVYGDAPNEIKLRELDTRWDYDDPAFANGIAENFRIDQSKHSLFGASKLAGDIMVQEYGRYFGMPVCCLRGGCLTGPQHSGVELHGFLSYLVKCNIEGREYKVFGYKGKQVRDNIHSFDLVEAFAEFIRAPRVGEVYNIGGSRHSNCSMLEAIEMCEEISGKELKWSYEEANRIGDHVWWISDVRKFQQHYPEWRFHYGMREILDEIYAAARRS